MIDGIDGGLLNGSLFHAAGGFAVVEGRGLAVDAGELGSGAEPGQGVVEGGAAAEGELERRMPPAAHGGDEFAVLTERGGELRFIKQGVTGINGHRGHAGDQLG